MKKYTSGDLLHNAKWLQTVGLYVFRQIREQTKFQGGHNPDYTGSVAGETKQVNHAGQFQGLYHEHGLQGRFEFVLVFLPVKVFGPNKI